MAKSSFTREERGQLLRFVREVIESDLVGAELPSPPPLPRLAEPGDMASPSRTIYQLSVADPKWIRAYLTERQLGLVKEGTLATVFTDTVGPVDGTVAFVSDTAEFTPKTVQTEDLRASLVYEVRITVRDPENRLRLGQPVTVEFAQPRSSPHD